MLTVLLFFTPISHQYSPLSIAGKALLIVQGPVDVDQVEEHVLIIPLIFLITLHPVSPSSPSQLTTMDSYSKCCCLFGTTRGKDASKRETQRMRLLKQTFVNEMCPLSTKLFEIQVNSVYIATKSPMTLQMFWKSSSNANLGSWSTTWQNKCMFVLVYYCMLFECITILRYYHLGYRIWDM